MPNTQTSISNKPYEQRAVSTGAVVLFVILVLGSSLGNLSQTAVNVMLELIVADFGIGIDVGQWLTTIYMLSLGIAVPATTFLAKRVRMRPYVLGCLALFALGALLDALTTHFVVLVVGRVFQAVASGLLMPVMQSTAMSRFPPQRQGTFMGIAGIAMGFMPNIGPTVGSLFAQTLGWRWFFALLALLPVPLIIAALLKIEREPDRPDRPSQSGIDAVRLDAGSLVMVAIGFGGLLTGLTLSSSQGVGNVTVWVLLAVGAVVLAAFLRRQRKVRNPLIDLAIFDTGEYTAGFWMQNLLFASFMGITLVIPLYVSGVLGGTTVDAGLVLLPGAITALVFNPLAGILADRFGKARIVRLGAGIYCAGALLALSFGEHTPLWAIALCQTVRGIGVSTSMSPTITWMLARLPRPIVTDGSSFTILVRQASSSLGTAVMTLLVTLASPAGEMFGYTLAFGFSAALGIIMFALALYALFRSEYCQ